MLGGRQAPDRSGQGLIMKRSAAGLTTRQHLLTGRTRTLFTIVRKTWSRRFVCAVMTAAPPMARQYQPTRRNAADCTVTLKSRRTEQFIFPITAALAQAPWLFQKITA